MNASKAVVASAINVGIWKYLADVVRWVQNLPYFVPKYMENTLDFNSWKAFIRAFFATPATRSVGLFFLLCNWVFGSWITHIPYLKNKMSLSEAELGWLLFALPVGHLFLNPTAGFIIKKWGAARVSRLMSIILVLLLPLPLFVPNVYAIAGILVFFGACLALLDIAMNACAAELTLPGGYTIFSTCHGMWSLGGVLSSIFAGSLLGLGYSPQTHIVLASIGGLLIIMVALPALMTIRDSTPVEGQKGFAKITPRMLLLILVGMFALLAEGMAFDWTGVFLRDHRGASPAFAAMGFGFFTFSMTIMRFMGDLIIPRVGIRPLLTIGCLTGAAGIGLAIGVPQLWAGMVGFMLLGIGCSLSAPILFGLSMQLPDVAPAAGLATFATFSFLAFLVGPPMIGFIAEFSSLSFSMLLVAGVLALGGILAQKL